MPQPFVKEQVRRELEMLAAAVAGSLIGVGGESVVGAGQLSIFAAEEAEMLAAAVGTDGFDEASVRAWGAVKLKANIAAVDAGDALDRERRAQAQAALLAGIRIGAVAIAAAL